MSKSGKTAFLNSKLFILFKTGNPDAIHLEHKTAFITQYERAFPRISDAVRSRYISVTSDELLVIYLRKLNFTQARIALIVCKSDAAINKTRRKLAKKLCGEVCDPLKALDAFLNSL